MAEPPEEALALVAGALRGILHVYAGGSEDQSSKKRWALVAGALRRIVHVYVGGSEDQNSIRSAGMGAMTSRGSPVIAWVMR